jgi:hypothetical protein
MRATDLEAIAKLLNEWEWDSDGEVEFIAHDGCLTPTVGKPSYPTVFADRWRVLDCDG